MHPEPARAAQLPATVLLTLLLPFLPSPSAAQPAVPLIASPDARLPVDLDADYSEFDRRNDRIVFRGLRIEQGPLSIRADEATASPADFSDSLWTFSGNVQVEDATTRVQCARAELRFVDNTLTYAVLEGEPAEFRQMRPEEDGTTTGRARRMEYDLSAGTMQMSGDAWLSDGQNEIAGSSITYDLEREVVRAGEGESGQVRIRITPPPSDGPGEDATGEPAEENSGTANPEGNGAGADGGSAPGPAP